MDSCKVGIGEVRRIDNQCDGISVETTCVFNKGEILALNTAPYTSQEEINNKLSIKLARMSTDVEALKKGIEDIKTHLKL